ncbi:S9 family peptidase [Teredinibacter haidensis]|mgnify:CR=1 FL=1|uniref:S9 family peptidase n=1 Tax=Teredinibacter haidensis TaxID=2731755 RepID=UPI000948F524|nr:prolyl oligopeptidase family serine peptidase [Teredinibacter haidensis]
MDSKQQRSYGGWPSDISAEIVAGKTPRLSEPCIHNNQLFWLQTLPDEKGRVAIMQKALDAPQSEPAKCLLPRPLSAKSKVHEYGGGSYWLEGNSLFFVLADDQQIYRTNLEQSTFTPEALTSSNTPFSDEETSSLRFADIIADTNGERLLAVCEQHFNKSDKEPVTRLTAIPFDRSQPLSIIAEGDDFYSNPIVSPCGNYLAWLCWNHPDMPWDATLLWLCKRDSKGQFSQANAKKIAGNHHESIFQPRFSPNGDLFFASDRNNWWNLYRIAAVHFDHNHVVAAAVTEEKAECATPQWTFRMSTYDFLNGSEILATFSANGSWKLAKINLAVSPPSTEYLLLKQACELSVIHGVDCSNGQATFVGASPITLPNIYHFKNGLLRSAIDQALPLNRSDISVPQAIHFATGHTKAETAYGFYYAPTSTHYDSITGKPPLIVICHGGPTGATENSLNLKIQYWTSRGFAVIDVNYRGSTGFGREYRHSLHYNWGVFDTEDVCAAADYAVEQGWANPEQLIIKGSSAGGYTVLATLTFTDRFNAGVSLYGIGDLETLVRDTHKFEARYLDKLIGDYKTEKKRYLALSPIHSVDTINCPLLVFQGLEDKVVPPNQAEAMVSAVKEKGLEVRYITFADEGHGFRNAHNIKTMLDEELRFYQRVFAL